MIKNLLVLLVATLWCPNVFSNETEEVSISYFRFGGNTRVQLSEEYVRRNPSALILMTDELYISDFKKWIFKEDMKKIKKDFKTEIDVRLVVDFKKGNKILRTLISDGNLLIDITNDTYRKVDSNFIRKFQFSEKRSWLDDSEG